MILPNVTIGKRCVIGAGSIVTKDVPDGMVVCGVPAKVIMTTQEYAERCFLKQRDYDKEAYNKDKKGELLCSNNNSTKNKYKDNNFILIHFYRIF